MAEDEMEEWRSSLASHREQLRNVEELLALDPGNDEYEEVRRNLLEVIELTQDLLSTAQQTELRGLKTGSGSPGYEKNVVESDAIAQQGLSGRLSVGSKVQAVWSGDGEWYDATVEAVTQLGYLVVYDGWGNKEEVDADNVREREVDEPEGNALLEAEKEAEATRLAIKRKIAACAEVDIMPKNLPPKLRINPDDPEDVKAAKRKKIHAFKSKMRLEQMEITQNKRQNAWQQFQSAKGKSKKVGFFTGRKRESIFKSPDDPKGKVGVTGSGKGITEFQKREKHLHLKVGNEESED